MCIGQLYDQPCTSQHLALDLCLAANNCTYSSDIEGSCSAISCLTQYKDASSCLCSNLKAMGGNCLYDPYCSGFPLWAIIAIAVGGVVILLVIVLLIVCLMRRRKQDYDTI
jgi:hypothetical protein